MGTRHVASPQGMAEGSERPIDGERDEKTSTLPSPARLYLASVYAAAIGLSALAIIAGGGRPSGEQLAAFAVLTVLSAAAQLFMVAAPNRHSYHLTLAFLLAAVLLLDPSLLVPMGLVILLPEWLRHRYPWYIQTFNISTYLLNMLAAWAVFRVVAGEAGLAVSWEAALGTVLAAVTFTMTNHVMVGLVLWLARGIPFGESQALAWGSLATDGALLFLGAGMAVFWAVDPLLLVLGVPPMFLLYRALYVAQLQEQVEDLKRDNERLKQLQVLGAEGSLAPDTARREGGRIGPRPDLAGAEPAGARPTDH